MSPKSVLGGSQGFEPHFFTSHVVNSDRLRENVLAFAERQGFSLTFTRKEPSPELEATFADASDRGVDILLNIGGPYDDIGTDVDIVNDEDTMAAHRDRIREITELYAEYFPEGRLYLWHEAPIHGNWRQQESLATVTRRREMADRVVEHGAKMFPAEKETIEAVCSTLDVGTFIHHPLLPSEDHTRMPVFHRLMSRLEEIGSLPDFTYCDMYRGYYEWETGYTGINDYIEDIVDNTKTATYGRPVHILLQAHTINNHYTPSKQAIIGNVQSAMDGGADGIGWYSRGAFRESHARNYNAFVPNHGEVDEEQFSTWSASRDRIQYASLLLAEQRSSFDPDQRFDLLIHGHDFDFHEHRVSIRRDGEWEFIEDISGYADGDNPYSGGDRDKISVLHALDRACLDGGLDVRIDSHDRGDGARLYGIYAVPYAGTPRFYTEDQATEWTEELSEVAFGIDESAADLSPGGTTTHHLVPCDPSLNLSDLTHPNWSDTLAETVATEADEKSSYRDKFDLWLCGENLTDLVVSLDDEDITCTHGAHGGREALIARGLPLNEFTTEHRTGGFIDLQIETNGADLRAAYAVPAHGAANFTTPAEVAAIITTEHTEGHGQIARFCLGTAFWPNGTTAVKSVETAIHVDDRTIVECDPVPDRHPIFSSTSW